ncbi:hypothetical protein SLE2022_365540 [Rubroshorea leprosula]
MARVPHKRLLFVAFLLFCFFSISASARSLPMARNEVGAQKSHEDVSTKNDEVESSIADEFMSMDYTPAKKKPPIHN